MIVKYIKPEETFAGTNIVRPEVVKEDLKTGEIVSLGTIVPQGYEDLKLGLIIEFYGSQGIEISWPEDKDSKYIMIRMADAVNII